MEYLGALNLTKHTLGHTQRLDTPVPGARQRTPAIISGDGCPVVIRIQPGGVALL